MPTNGGTVTGGTTGYTYQLWSLDYGTVQMYDTLDRLTNVNNVSTLSNSDSGQSYTVSGNIDTAQPYTSETARFAPTGQSGTTNIAINGLSTVLNGDAVIVGIPNTYNSSTTIAFYLTSNTYIYAIGANTTNNLSAYCVVNGSTTLIASVTISGSTYPSVTLRLKWATVGSTTSIYAGYATTNGTNFGAATILPTLALYGTLSGLSTIAPKIGLIATSSAGFIGSYSPNSGTTFAIPIQINVPSIVALTGTATSGSSASASLTDTWKFTGTATSASTATATLQDLWLFTGTATSRSSASANLSVAVALSGTATSASQSTATLVQNPQAISGIATAGSSASAILGISVALTGIATMGSSASVYLGAYMGTAYPFAYIKTQLVKVYSPSGQFIDVWRDAPLLDGFKEALQSATTPLRVKLPRSFDNFDEVGTTAALGSIGQGNVVQWLLFGPGLPYNGLLRYQGVIDAYEPTIDDNGEEYVTVTVTPKGSAVGDNSLIGEQAFGTPGQPATYQDPISMFNHWFGTTDPATGRPYPYPLGQDSTNPASSGYSTQYTFVNQTMQDIWDTILLLLPSNWFWRVNVDGSVTLNQSPATPQHTFILGRHCVSLGYTKDWTQLKNNVLVQGGNNPTTGLPITANKIGSDITVYGNRSLLINESRITDQTTANVYAAGLLAINDTVQYRATLRILDYRGDTSVGLGYEIESLAVGHTCTVIAPQTTTAPPTPPSYFDQMSWDQSWWDSSPANTPGGGSTWDVSSWDSNLTWDYGPGRALGQTAQIVGIDYHFDYVDVTLAALRPSQDAKIARLQARLQSALLTSTADGPALWG